MDDDIRIHTYIHTYIQIIFLSSNWITIKIYLGIQVVEPLRKILISSVCMDVRGTHVCIILTTYPTCIQTGAYIIV